MTPEDRFWAKVDKTETCWLWTAAKDPRGYGRFRVRPRTVFAHRHAYELAHGPVDRSLVLDHLCRQPSCVRPDHLDPVPHAVNVRRGIGAEVTRAYYAEHRFCPKGHPLFGDNLYLYVTKAGVRNKQCRTCRNDNRRARRAAGKEH